MSDACEIPLENASPEEVRRLLRESKVIAVVGLSAIAAEAEKGLRNLRPATERVRATAWLFPVFSSHWHDAFGYAQLKTDVRTGIGLRPYLSVRFVGDSRRTLPGVEGPPQYLSESSVIFGGGLATTPFASPHISVSVTARDTRSTRTRCSGATLTQWPRNVPA